MKMSLFKHSLVRLLCLFAVIAVVAARPGKKRHDSARYNLEHRLVGGEPVQEGEFPFLASLRVMPKELHRCGGFLVSRVHVMTTATCIYSTGTKELHAYMNPLRFDNLGTYIKVKDVVSHPNFTLTPHENDVAILRLEKAYEVKHPVIPDWVDLPTKANVITFGWGYDKMPGGGVGNFTLHMFKLQIMNNGLCSLILREYLNCDTLCATSPVQFATSPADFGTPLILVGEGEMYAVGMLVRDTDDLVNAAPYMKLRGFLEWSRGVIDGKTTTAAPVTTTTGSTTTEETTTTTPPPEETTEYYPDTVDYHEQPIKGRSKKRSTFQREVFREGSLMGGKRQQISRFG